MKNISFSVFALVLIAILSLLTAGGCCIPEKNGGTNVPEQPENENLSQHDVMSDTWTAVDSLGRVLPGNAETGDLRKDRFVGMFFWTWHLQQSRSGHAPINVNSIVTDNPDASHDLNYSEWGELYAPHHWNEPIYGFYDSDDRWVLRKQAELLAAAGVDVVIFDTTNGTLTFKDAYDVLFEVFAQARADGVKTPQIAFLLPFDAGGENTVTQLRMLYEDIYSTGRHNDLWFYWKGKPLIMANRSEMLKSGDKTDREICDFFTFRPGIAPYNMSSEDMTGDSLLKRLFNTEHYWSWLSVYPQAINKNPDGSPEQMAVSVAQNYCAETGLTAMNGENVFGRTYTSEGYDTREDAVQYGANFAEQAEYALEADPEFIFITGWNEWVAGRHDIWQNVINAFPDEYNDEFSRDIEPTKGALKDNYYYQLVDFIRRYKGTRTVEADTQNITIKTLSDWDKVENTYLSYTGNTFDRNDYGYGKIHYTDESGLNDIVSAKITSDSENVYFLLTCQNTISKDSLKLLISMGETENTWEGYSYLADCSSGQLEKFNNSWNRSAVCEVIILADGCNISLTIPKSALGIGADGFTLDFKWTDNNLTDGDIMTLYTKGDTAPTGRFNFRYISK